MTTWSGGAAAAYDASFGLLCAGIVSHVLERLPRGAGASLLDVGAGTGRLSAEAAASGLPVTAIEPDPAMLAVARSRMLDLDLDLDVPCVQGGAPRLPFPDVSFDHAVAAFVVPLKPERLAPQEDCARTPDGVAQMAEECGLEIDTAVTVAWTSVDRRGHVLFQRPIDTAQRAYRRPPS